MAEHGKLVLVKIPPVFGIDMSVTTEVALIWIAGLATFLLLLFACRRQGLYAKGGYQNFFESIIEFVDKEIVRSVIGPESLAWSPFILTIFFFILFCNLLGLVPVPGTEEHPLFKPITSNINVPATLAVTVFLTTIVVDVYRHGFVGFLKKLIPGGVPGWIAPFIFPLEVVTRVARPLSLTLRLFANMTAGHAIQAAFMGLVIGALPFLKPLPYIGTVLMAAFEIFVCFIQAFVFSILTGFYLSEALEGSH